MPDQPLPQFNRFARLEEISAKIGAQTRQLLAGVHAEGVKDGIEMAAQLCDNVARAIRGEAIVTEVNCVQIATAEFLRDQARLLAHQIPDPEASNG